MVYETMLKKTLFMASFLVLVGIFTQHAYGIELEATPEKDPVGPNDWIRILVEIDGYQGGNVDWVAHLPDGSTQSGSLSGISAGKKIHTIIRTAFDNQFGDWQVDYSYQGLLATASVTVEPLLLEITSDKQTYKSGDVVIFTITTNHFNPSAALAESYRIEFFDSAGMGLNQVDSVIQKAWKSSTTYEFSINELLNNNPYGDYKAVVNYYNVYAELQFKVANPDLVTSIFIGTDKEFYQAGELVELQLIIPVLIGSNAIITVTDPSGKNTIRSFQVDYTLTRVILDDVSTTIPGTYLIVVEYADTKETKTFSVGFDTFTPSGPSIDLTVSLDKQNYRPGETLTASIKTDQLIADNVSYWVEDPSGSQGTPTTAPMTSGSSLIPYHISKEAPQGPWKFYVNYGGAVRYAIFFIEGEPLDQTIITTPETYEGPEILLTLDGSSSNLIDPQGIAISSNNEIYVVDSGNFEIKKFDSSGRLMDSWGSFGAGEGQFKNPRGIFLDSEFVHVADTGNSRIQTFDKNGNFVKSWGNSGIVSQSLRDPTSMAVDSSGIFYISDAGLNKISKYDSNGDYAGHIQSLLTSAAKFSSSDYIISNNGGNFLILVSDDNRILQYNANGDFITSFGTAGDGDGKFQNPSAMAIDVNGNLYVADSGNSRIQIFDSEKKFLGKWGTLGSSPGQFNQISGITVDTVGNVFVVDSKNNRIQKFAPFVNLQKLEIPDWVRNNAQWWKEGAIDDSDFANGIQYMIEQEIIVIPGLEETGEATEQQIPDWVKNNAGWWAEGLISDKDFANGIEFLVQNGIIRV